MNWTGRCGRSLVLLRLQLRESDSVLLSVVLRGLGHLLLAWEHHRHHWHLHHRVLLVIATLLVHQVHLHQLLMVLLNSNLLLNDHLLVVNVLLLKSHFLTGLLSRHHRHHGHHAWHLHVWHLGLLLSSLSHSWLFFSSLNFSFFNFSWLLLFSNLNGGRSLHRLRLDLLLNFSLLLNNFRLLLGSFLSVLHFGAFVCFIFAVLFAVLTLLLFW